MSAGTTSQPKFRTGTFEFGTMSCAVQVGGQTSTGLELATTTVPRACRCRARGRQRPRPHGTDESRREAKTGDATTPRLETSCRPGAVDVDTCDFLE